ncbi:hypothetical protein Goklo_019387 [Gossypium klotzschianum]|uniref:Bax inhibitor 1 n=1 Tax=Gossypium klotzschianum TaxID=34286 RepID=A0A7J8UNK4_9ROSI|nr:hypothetical protein [Gossypium klotzschianum]
MDAFTSFFDSQSRNIWSYDTLKNFRQISPIVQAHLKQVYLTLCCALIASAVGAYLHILWNIGGYLTTFACLGTIIWLLSTPPCEEQKRVSLLMASAVFEGASIGPLIDLAIQIDPRSCYVSKATRVPLPWWLALIWCVRASLIYLGLLVFVGYMIVDTQDIIEKAHLGDLDYVKHALTLFTDFVAVFVRILIIMLKNSAEKSEKKKKRRD